MSRGGFADRHTKRSRKLFVAVFLRQIYRLACPNVFDFSVLVVLYVSFVHDFAADRLNTVSFLLRSYIFEANKFRFPVSVYEFVTHISLICGRRKIFFLMPDIRQRINAVLIRENPNVKGIDARLVIIPIASETHVFHARPRVGKRWQLHRGALFIYRIGNICRILIRPFPSVVFIRNSIIRSAFLNELHDCRLCNTVFPRRGEHDCAIGRKRKSFGYSDFF